MVVRMGEEGVALVHEGDFDRVTRRLLDLLGQLADLRSVLLVGRGDHDRQLNLKVIHVLGDPPEGWAGETGYVTADVLRRYLPKQYKRFIYFICGPDPMMDAMEEALPELGVPHENVQTERFAMV